MAASVTYLGYHIDYQGLHPVPEKMEAIQRAHPPRNVSELKVYLCLWAHKDKHIRSLKKATDYLLCASELYM